MPLPIFKVKEESIYSFDKLFETVIAKYPWIKQCGYFKVLSKNFHLVFQQNIIV